MPLIMPPLEPATLPWQRCHLEPARASGGGVSNYLTQINQKAPNAAAPQISRHESITARSVSAPSPSLCLSLPLTIYSIALYKQPVRFQFPLSNYSHENRKQFLISCQTMSTFSLPIFHFLAFPLIFPRWRLNQLPQFDNISAGNHYERIPSG